jgi:flagellar hook assembly protein FlgD
VGELIPTTFELNDNYPNPFNPSTTIHYGLPEDAQISLVIYDILGREVSTLVSEVQEAGWYDVRWYGLDESGRPMSAGIYLLRIQTQNFVEVKRMILVR